MTGRSAALFRLLLALLAGCAPASAALDAGSGGAEAGAPIGDAGPVDAAPPPACDGTPPLELGRCLGDLGLACDGTETAPMFDALGVGETITPVVGPQGSAMLSLAARAAGIVPGDPAMPTAVDNPVLDLLLLDEASHEVAHFSSRNGFRPVVGATDTYESVQLYVIVESILGGINGRTFSAIAQLRDATGALRCGRLEFVAE